MSNSTLTVNDKITITSGKEGTAGNDGAGGTSYFSTGGSGGSAGASGDGGDASLKAGTLITPTIRQEFLHKRGKNS